MNLSIRTKFTLGMIFLFIIILVLSVSSAFYMNKLSDKTSAILKENYLSVVYAREISEGMMNINQEITTCFLTHKDPDSLKILRELTLINKALQSAKNNLTEPGEDKLVAAIDTDVNEYRNIVMRSLKRPDSESNILFLQNKSGDLYNRLVHLMQMNGTAIEAKTDDAKIAAKNALTQMTILATLCFLIGFSFTFSFASYFNERFFQLYNGIKEIVSNNYDQRLFFSGKDEFYEISMLFNEMAEKLKKNKQKMAVTLIEESGKEHNINDIQELKNFLLRVKTLEEQAIELISRLEKK